MGSGTTGIAAIKSERKYIGYEINDEYVKVAQKRLKILQSQARMFV
jgi:site-specific DNA-methyltransferase (adenine-specific)